MDSRDHPFYKINLNPYFSKGSKFWWVWEIVQMLDSVKTLHYYLLLSVCSLREVGDAQDIKSPIRVFSSKLVKQMPTHLLLESRISLIQRGYFNICTSPEIWKKWEKFRRVAWCLVHLLANTSVIIGIWIFVFMSLLIES